MMMMMITIIMMMMIIIIIIMSIDAIRNPGNFSQVSGHSLLMSGVFD